MGEEEKKPPEEAKKPEEEKIEEVKKSEEKKEESPAPPPPPLQIILKVFMHCEGCARKVRKCLRGFEGVEYVLTDCKSHQVVVKGEKADPLKILERLQRKSHKQVELISPIPKPPTVEDKKPDEEASPKPEEKKEERPQVITVVLKIYMHCEACAQEIKKRIQKMEGVESAESDLKSSEVTVKGVFQPAELVDNVYKRTGKQAVIVKQDPPEKKEEEKPKDASNDDKKGEEGGDEKEKNENGGDENEKKEGNAAETSDAAEGGVKETKVVEVKRNEYYYYPPTYAVEMYAYPPAPQIFSDENPNACSIV